MNKKTVRPPQPKACPQLIEMVLCKMDMWYKKPIIRAQNPGYIVGVEPTKKSRAVALVNGDFGRAEFKAVISEMITLGLVTQSVLVVAKTATYSGWQILLRKFEELAIAPESH